MTGGRPSVVLITTDQQPWGAVGAHDNPYISTPNMDRLVEAGESFERAYATDPVCCPQRTSWITGRYSSETGSPFNGGALADDIPDLGELLRAGGYETFHAGKWHVDGREITRSFIDLYSGERQILASGGQIYDVAIADAVCEFLEHRDPAVPFFLQVHFVNPHDICEYLHDLEDKDPPPLSSLGLVEDDLPPLPDNFDYDPSETYLHRAACRVDGCFIHDEIRRAAAKWSSIEWRQYIWHFYRFVERVDRQIGRVLDAIEHFDRGTGSTSVLFSADHGEGLASHRMFQKFTLYEESVRVPLVGVGPRFGAPGSRNTTVVSTLDIFATVCDLAGVERSPGSHGRSLVEPAVPDEARSAYIESNFLARAVVTDRLKYVTEYLPHPGQVEPPRASTNERGLEQLFDLSIDPGETRNLASDPARADDLEEVRLLLLEWEATLDVRAVTSEWGIRIATDWGRRVLELRDSEESLRLRGGPAG